MSLASNKQTLNYNSKPQNNCWPKIIKPKKKYRPINNQSKTTTNKMAGS